MIQFTIEQFNAWRNLIFLIGLEVGCGIGACGVFIANILLGKYDEIEEREKEENESN